MGLAGSFRLLSCGLYKPSEEKEKMMLGKTNITRIAERIEKPYTHLPLGKVDDASVYVSRFEGAYIFHQHDRDEMYIVLEGEVVIEYADGSSATLKPNDALVVQAGVEHRSRSEESSLVLMVKHSGMFAEY
jgi:mannose-6-phosphate isomerase-like protein (cupin superfamily)